MTQSEQEKYINSVENFSNESLINYQLAQDLTRKVFSELMEFRENNLVESMTIDEYERLLRSEKAVLTMLNEALDIGAKSLGIEHVLETLNKKSKEAE
jgi:hypothetical protein